MMLKHSPLRVLVWKDVSVLLPLALGLAGLLVVLALVAMTTMSDPRNILDHCVILFPNLVALGAPILLLGHEEETGTLNWQRALPVNWRVVWASKWLAAGFVTLIVCAVAAIVSWIGSTQWGLLPDGVGNKGFEAYRALSFTCMLLGAVMLICWFMRGATAALFTVVPIMVLLFAIAAQAGVWLSSSYAAHFGIQAANRDTLFVGFVQSIVSVVLFALSFGVARSRWLKSESPASRFLRMFSRADKAESHPAYVPATPVEISAPHVYRVLLWQWRQQAKVYLLGVGGIAFLALASLFNDFARDSLILMMLLGNGLLGVSVFMGDTMKQRYRYLAQLGVSRWTVWWSRFIQMTTIALLFNVFVCVVGYFAEAYEFDTSPVYASTFGDGVLFVTSFCVVPLVMGMICAMWARRPVVGALAHIILTVVALVFGAVFLAVDYSDYPLAVIPPVVVLFLLTVRMQGRWLDGDRGIGYAGRFVGWLGLSAAAFVLSILVLRFWETPRLDPQWQKATIALSSEILPPDFVFEEVSLMLRQAYPWGGNEAQVDLNLDEESLSQLRECIARIQSGENVMVAEAYGSITLDRAFRAIVDAGRLGENGPLGSEHRFWYTGILDLGFKSMEGLASRRWLVQSDQADDWEALLSEELALEDSRVYLGEEMWNAYVNRLRTPEQRSDDRRKALLYSWGEMTRWQPREVGRREDAAEQKFLHGFGGYTPRTYPGVFTGIEYARTDRYLNEATRVSLGQLDSGTVVAMDGAEERNRIRMWAEAFGMDLGRPFQQFPTRHWNGDFTDRVEALRGKLAQEE